VATARPLEGIRVVELASWVMAPACGAILSAYGAEVVKVEPAGSGDPSRGSTIEVEGEQIESGFELANNRKRSIQLDLGSEAGQEVMHRLLRHADVFLTNVRHKSLERATLAPAALAGRYPDLIIAHATGYGTQGSAVDRASFDELAYWSRGGMASSLRIEGGPPVGLAGAMGDLPSAVALVAGISLALYRREREGCGGIVDVSLYQCGMWANGWLLQQALLGAPARVRRGREHAHSPLYNSYVCRDEKWVQFAMLQPRRYWRPLCEAIGRPELAEDERFATHEALLEHASEAVREIEQTIGEMDRDDLGRRLDARDLPWSPIFDSADIIADEQARQNGYIVRKTHRSGREIESLSPPFHLRGVELAFGPAPESGQDTEIILSEAGYGWDEIEALRDRGAF
jgi:crotonobetainyl-CoA:carnitine CoA-transferase CaiB-like acyl-CoA transferase